MHLVEREGDEAHAGWHEWSPEAAFFHFSTKNGVFPTDLGARDQELVEKAKHDAQPAPAKRIDGPRVSLDRHDLSSADLATTLAKRRTWRNFADREYAGDLPEALLS